MSRSKAPFCKPDVSAVEISIIEWVSSKVIGLLNTKLPLCVSPDGVSFLRQEDAVFTRSLSLRHNSCYELHVTARSKIPT